MSKYNHKEIEKKWQKTWDESGLNSVDINSNKPKFYALDMFPYPSGEGLHVGHPKGYIATDIYSRYKRLAGYEVLHPMGWDAFGLPAENYALKNKIHPEKSVSENIQTFKKQLNMLGLNYDWDKEINTTDPDYYKWTQWIFLQMFNRGLAYESDEPIIWCPSCKTGLAQEDLEEGKCERCSSEIEMRPLRQWVLKITDYADRLLVDLDSPELNWEEQIKEQQRNWIGKSEGAEIVFKVQGSKYEIKVFTTRPDTIFGATFMVLAPENSLVKEITTETQLAGVENYIGQTLKKTELQRMEGEKHKTGVFTGAFAVNPANGKEIPIWISDYVLMGYGHGAIMAVPAHDERDWDFAKKYDLPIVPVLKSPEENKGPFVGDGVHINSDYLDGLNKEESIKKAISVLGRDGLAESTINYRLRDWVFSRQRYWGEPIPVIHCQKCGAVGVPEEDLPVKLPKVERYEPTDTGESPLANITDWVNTKCPKCGGSAQRETNTMPQWAGSSWYYLRYIDNKNDKALVDIKKEKEWIPVDLYVGGIEHATRHLLYARFWHKFLYDIGVVSGKEPFKRLIHVGLIQAEDGRKMSKRWGNVINPNEVVNEYGADAMRVYEMFMGPFTQEIAWSTKGLIGARRFLDKVWRLYESEIIEGQVEANNKIIARTIKKVGGDIDDFKFNTAISSLMILINVLSENKKQSRDSLASLAVILAPFVPYLAEELWEKLGNKGSVHTQMWPEYDESLIESGEVVIAIQVNGKLRGTIRVSTIVTQKEIEALAFGEENVKSHLAGQKPKKIIYVPGKILNIVI